MTHADEETDLAEAVRRTAEALDVGVEEVDWITPELLREQTQEAGPDLAVPEEDGGADVQGVVPNRITYISHVATGFNGTATSYTFYANCTWTDRYLLWSDAIDRFERDGWCRTPNGSYAKRWKMWWRA
ncbi:hypothetical protein [Blastococcus sp. CT_GayMR16]|uniref:hypothetical protein n=1 Tax=Blastococcus sp. CT_GayMR16 TaxID=2559607 RepID=UPI0010743297|nr:hypothetical protein [Blastococcus sp. CT_GayMR16]TFV86588.1 hypothetical protein E4P38_16380 [Blastococcus sp. CT_GayMR16]